MYFAQAYLALEKQLNRNATTGTQSYQKKTERLKQLKRF